MDFQDSLVFRADFNQIDEDGFVKTSLYHGSSRRIPRRGERIYLQDGEGNKCWAEVHDVQGVIVRAELDKGTWIAGGDETQTISASGSGVAAQWSPAKEPVVT